VTALPKIESSPSLAEKLRNKNEKRHKLLKQKRTENEEEQHQTLEKKHELLEVHQKLEEKYAKLKPTLKSKELVLS